MYYQSPYLRRFSSTRFNGFSNEKESANKENVSPLSTDASHTQNSGSIGSHHYNMNGAGASVSTTSGGGNTVQNTPIQSHFRGGLFFHNSLNREREVRESPTFQLSLINSASPLNEAAQPIKDSDDSASHFYGADSTISSSVFAPFDSDHTTHNSNLFF